MNATLTRKKQQQPTIDGDALDALEQDARRRIEALTADRARLSLDALTGEDERQELADIERQLAAAHGELERVGLAREESGRRERETRERAERDAREQAAKRAEKLHGEVAKSARALDEDMRTFARHLAAHHALLVRLSAELGAAGERRDVRLDPSRVQAALAHHLGQAGAAGKVELGLVARPGPLVPRGEA